MSTRIYNAFRLPAMSLMELTAFMGVYRAQAREIMHRLYVREFARHVAETADALALGRPELPRHETLMSEAFWHLDEQLRRGESSARRDEGIDLSVSVSVFAIEGATLAMVHTEHAEYVEAFAALPQAESYDYQNSSDCRPEGVSKKAWQQRKRDWDAALPSGVPADCGPGYRFPTATCLDRYRGILPEVAAAAASRRQRAEAKADDVLFARKHRKKVTADNFGALVMRHLRWLRTEDGQKARAAEADKIEKRLIELSEQTLQAPLSTLFSRAAKAPEKKSA